MTKVSYKHHLLNFNFKNIYLEIKLLMNMNSVRYVLYSPGTNKK